MDGSVNLKAPVGTSIQDEAPRPEYSMERLAGSFEKKPVFDEQNVEPARIGLG